MYALGFLVVILVLGLVRSPWALFAVPAATLLAFAFAAVGMAATTFMRSWQDFDLINLVVLPLFLFSGTFYPLSAYPEPMRILVQATPLWQGVDMIRALITGVGGPGDPVARGLSRGHGARRPRGGGPPAGPHAAQVGPPGTDCMPPTEPAAAARAARDLPALDDAITGVRRLSAPGRLARGAGTGQGRPVPRRAVLGPAGPGLRRSGTRGSCSSASRPPPTAPTARVASSPGDASGDFLWRALHAVGLADRPVGRRAGDGLTLRGVRVTAAVRCAPPANRPTPAEQATCRPYLVRELELLGDLRVIVPLGAIGWDATLRSLAALGHVGAAPKAAVRPWRGGIRRPVHGPRVRITRASRTRSPAASRRRCWRRCWPAP